MLSNMITSIQKVGILIDITERRRALITQLRRMIGFTFTRHRSINLPEEHLRAMEKFVQERAAYLMALSKTKKS